MAQIQFSLIKKIKIGHPEHSLTPTPLRPITSHFCVTPPPTPQSGRHMCITPKSKRKQHARARYMVLDYGVWYGYALPSKESIL